MVTNRVELHSSLSQSECVALISEAIDRENFALLSFSSFFGSKPVLGRVTESSLYLRKRIGYSNSAQPFLSARIQTEGDGTIITGEFGVHPLVRLFMAIWFGGVIVIGSVIFLRSVIDLISGTTYDGSNPWIGIIAPPVMLSFGIGLVRFCRYLARDEAKFLTDFLVKLLRAEPSETRAI